MSVTVGAHLSEEVAIRTRVLDVAPLGRGRRVTVALEGEGVSAVTLFADRAGLVRLRDELSTAITVLEELDTPGGGVS